MTNGLLELNCGCSHNEVGSVNEIDTFEVLVHKINDISSTFGVNFFFTNTESELSAIVPKIKTKFPWNFYAFTIYKRKEKENKNYVQN